MTRNQSHDPGLQKLALDFPKWGLVFAHFCVIVLSNYAVQLPLTVFGWQATWGMFTYPFVFVLSDLTVRLFGSVSARSIVNRVALPAFLASYLVGVLFEKGSFQGMGSLLAPNLFVIRIAFASLTAYFLSQFLDIHLFSRVQRYFNKRTLWWVAPGFASFFATVLDNYVFYVVAFYASPDVFMAANWGEIATTDLTLKLIVNLSVFLPLYGVFLDCLMRRWGTPRAQV